MNILITGASGLIGSSLMEFLFNRGHSFYSLQRNKGEQQDQFWDMERLHQSEKLRFDAVVHLAGENIASGRWSRKKKKLIKSSRIDGTRQLAEFCAKLSHKPEVFLCASAIGYYGNGRDRVLDENSNSGDNFVAEVCREWESATAPAAEAGIRVVYGRIGLVLSGKGGTLPTMLPSFKLGIAGIVGGGSQFLSWVGLDELLNMILFLLETKAINGPVNLVEPEPITNREFTKILGKVVGKPTILPMPSFVAHTVFGQMGRELILSSARIVPRILLDNGYGFISPDLEQTLEACVAGKV